ncbi:MAG: 4-hydroxythreonine-4-phosphate dehydrogenase PdxA [Candidatus Omnitrophica bacterium]|nr:4-hydroxythreonine-4-phosphate dehydrogenase PdxA [Candidatus Omnitrophota bacterium]
MPTSLSSKPSLVLTMGDPAGIGPEIILKALAKPAVKNLANYIIVGDLKILNKTKSILNKYRIPCLNDLSQINILDLKNVPMSGFCFGKEKAVYGRASIEYIKKAFELIEQGIADGMVTAPINKSAVRKSGFPFPGHTEYLASLAGVKNFVMMLSGGPLKVSLVTRHIRLRDVSEKLTTRDISNTIALTLRALKTDFGITDPRVGVCALNPHASDGGMFGDEEKEIVSPAVRIFRNSGVQGPFPADALFYDAYNGRFDCVICLYHDQGLIPLKMVARDSGVNITLGLGFVRTSPDHGTAFDIAGKGKADPRSMEIAIKTAANMALNRKKDALKKRN